MVSRVIRVCGRSVRILRAWYHRYEQWAAKRKDQLAAMQAAMKVVHESVGPSVHQMPSGCAALRGGCTGWAGFYVL